ncbi:MAG: hypothetical protein NZ809_01905 [Thermodesulfovibrio sp.]|nr:hypothetical protein [Thermodesulfovibrio sp.]
MFEGFKKNPYFKETLNFLVKKNLVSETYLVGGTVRDLLIGIPTKDIDLTLRGDTVTLAREFAKEVGGSFVLLDEFFSIARVVKDDVTIDFAEMRGNSIEEDLAERDFTINAIAYSLAKDELIDPFSGQKDIENRIIRMIKEKNLRDDPLRILRAYRFHATLKFEIEEGTRDALRKNASLMKVTAKERVKEELWRILSVKESFCTIKFLEEDEIFKALFKFSEIVPLKINLQAFKTVEEILNQIEDIFSLPIQKVIQKPYIEICLKFAAIFNFQAPELIKQLKPSKKEYKLTEELVKAGIRLRKIETLLDKVRFIRDFEHIIYPSLIYGLSQDPFKLSRIWFYRDIEDFYRKNYLKNKKKLPIIRGDDIISLGIQPSPLVGEILEKIEILTLAGKISKKEEAIEEIKKRYLSNISPP